MTGNLRAGVIRKLFYSFVGLTILGIDAWTKWATQAYLPTAGHGSPCYPYGGLPVFRDFFGIEFSVVHTTNSGTIWGLFPHNPGILAIIRLGVIGFLIAYVYRARQTKSLIFPIILVLFGAVGNVVDYFLYGHVIDLFFFRFWGWSFPVFNVADTCIFLGVVSLLSYGLLTKRFGNARS